MIALSYPTVFLQLGLYFIFPAFLNLKATVKMFYMSYFRCFENLFWSKFRNPLIYLFILWTCLVLLLMQFPSTIVAHSYLLDFHTSQSLQSVTTPPLLLVHVVRGLFSLEFLLNSSWQFFLRVLYFDGVRF